MNTQIEVEEYISQITPTANEAMSMTIQQNNGNRMRNYEETNKINMQLTRLTVRQ